MDGTGPYGAGPATGRRSRPCIRGIKTFGNKEEEAEILKREKNYLKKEIEEIDERLSQIESR